MGLFGKKAAEPAPAPTPIVKEKFEKVRVNLSDKMLRVELSGDSGYVKHGSIQREDDRLRVLSSGGIIIAEVTPKSKVFGELEPYVGRTAEAIEIKAKTGDYGPYYQVSLKFGVTVVE